MKLIIPRLVVRRSQSSKPLWRWPWQYCCVWHLSPAVPATIPELPPANIICRCKLHFAAAHVLFAATALLLFFLFLFFSAAETKNVFAVGKQLFQQQNPAIPPTPTPTPSSALQKSWLKASAAQVAFVASKLAAGLRLHEREAMLWLQNLFCRC